MKRLVGTMLLFHACTGYGQTVESQLAQRDGNVQQRSNKCGRWYNRYSFQTGNVTSVGILPQYDPLQILTLNWSFDALYDCNRLVLLSRPKRHRRRDTGVSRGGRP